MKKIGLAALLLTAWAGSTQLNGALVKTLQGGVQVKEGAGSRVLHLFDPVSPSQKLTIPAGARLELLFRGDGHREVIQGPGTVLVEANRCRVVGGKPKVETRAPVLGRTVVARSGTLDAIGGHVDKGVSPGAGGGNIERGDGKNAKVFQLRIDPNLETPWGPEPPVAKMRLEWSAERGWDAVAKGFIAPDRVELLLLDASTDKVVRKFPGASRVALGSELQADRPYRLVVVSGGEINAILVFRQLSKEEGLDFLSLPQLAESEKRAGFEKLGLHHLAAQAVEEQLHKKPDAELLQYLVDYYAHIAQWPQGVHYWRAWGEGSGLHIRG